MTLKQLKVETQGAPQRLDVFLANSDLGISRSQIKRLIGEGRVTLNGRRVHVSWLVKRGEEILIDKPDEPTIEFQPEAIPLEIIYEDDFLAVVNKPAGLVTHPAHKNKTGTLANALLYHFRNLSSGYAKGYPGLVHRLDKNTSGLMIVARNDRVHAALASQLEKRTLQREYQALIWGTLKPPSGTINLSIGRSRSDRRIMSSGSPKTREAVTMYETVEEFPFLSYIKVRLKTGRTHQIRTHLKESGRPVFGDPEYSGRETRLTGIEARHRIFAKKLLAMTTRQLLHAARLEFVHPESGKTMEFAIDPPDDFGQILTLVRQYR